MRHLNTRCRETFIHKSRWRVGIKNSADVICSRAKRGALILPGGRAQRKCSLETRETSHDENRGTKGRIFIRDGVSETEIPRLQIVICVNLHRLDRLCCKPESHRSIWLLINIPRDSGQTPRMNFHKKRFYTEKTLKV